MADADGRRRAGPWWSVALLSALYLVSIIDRVILALFVGPLKAELYLSDVQIGILFGPAFALLYVLVGLPIARWADRGNRRRLLCLGVTLWSAATIGSAFATSFPMLLAMRMGLAVGEATLTPCAFSIIGDLFPPARRATAASIYTAIGMAGSSMAYIVGGLLLAAIEHWSRNGDIALIAPWRAALLIVASVTLLVGATFFLSTTEPARSRGAPDDDAAAGPGPVIRYIRNNLRIYLGIFVGAGLLQAIYTAYLAWGAELLRRHYGFSIQDAGIAFGLAGLCAGAGGTLFFPAAAARLKRHGRDDAVALTSAAGALLSAVAGALAPLQHGAPAFLACYALMLFCAVGSANNILVILQTMVPARMRATMTAISLATSTLLGMSLGPTATAVISGAFGGAGGALAGALAAVSLIMGVSSAAMFASSRLALSRQARGANAVA